MGAQTPSGVSLYFLSWSSNINLDLSHWIESSAVTNSPGSAQCMSSLDNDRFLAFLLDHQLSWLRSMDLHVHLEMLSLLFEKAFIKPDRLELGICFVIFFSQLLL